MAIELNPVTIPRIYFPNKNFVQKMKDIYVFHEH